MAVSHIDAKRFPRTSAYLDSLGNNLKIYPEAKARPDIYTDVLEAFAALKNEPSLSHSLRDALTSSWASWDWMPECWGVALLCMVRDSAFESDVAFLRWNYSRFASIYRKPLYRALMLVLSPTLMFMGATKRWGAFHQGTTLESRGIKSGAHVRLVFPKYLFPQVFLISLVSPFQAALEMAGAKDVKLVLESNTDEEARYSASWD